MERSTPGDTAWVLLCGSTGDVHDPGAGVVLRRHGAGEERARMLMNNFFCLGIVSVLWAVVALLAGLRRHAATSSATSTLRWMNGRRPSRPTGLRRLTIPPLAFLAFQLMFAVITPALITGAIADRDAVRGVGVVRAAVGRARVRAGRALGVLAVGLAVQARRARLRRRHGRAHQRRHRGARRRASCSASAAAGRGTPMPPHSLPLTLIGAGHPVVRLVRVQRRFGARRATASRRRRSSTRTWPRPRRCSRWLLVERLRSGHATTLGAASGLVAGLVAITPCAGFVGGDVVDLHRADRRCDLRLRGELEVQVRLRRLARRRRRAPRRRPHRLAARRRVRRRRVSTRRSRTAPGGGGLVETGNLDLLGEQVIAVGATHGLVVRGDADHHAGAEACSSRRGSASMPRTRRHGPRPHPALRDRATPSSESETRRQTNT